MTTVHDKIPHVVVTDSRQRDNEMLFLVDARIHKSHWSNEIGDALVFRTKDRADRRAATMLHNNPRSMTLAGATVISQQQRMERLAAAETQT